MTTRTRNEIERRIADLRDSLWRIGDSFRIEGHYPDYSAKWTAANEAIVSLLVATRELPVTDKPK